MFDSCRVLTSHSQSQSREKQHIDPFAPVENRRTRETYVQTQAPSKRDSSCQTDHAIVDSEGSEQTHDKPSSTRVSSVACPDTSLRDADFISSVFLPSCKEAVHLPTTSLSGQGRVENTQCGVEHRDMELTDLVEWEKELLIATSSLQERQKALENREKFLISCLHPLPV